MQERLIVKNFGPIKDVDLDLRQTTVFIGEQASGKSTLAKLIAIFRSANHRNNLILGNYNPFNDYLINDFFSKNTYFDYISEKAEFSYKNGKFEFYKDEKIDELAKMSFNNITKSNIINDYVNEESFINRLILENKIMKSDGIEQIFKQLSKILSVDIYIPAERTLIPMIAKSLYGIIDLGIGLPKTITGFGNLFERARQQEKKIEIPFLNLNYEFIGGKDIIKHNSINIELANSSSGLQALIPMFLVLKASPVSTINLHFIIEEPELNLYPTTQHNLTKFIAAKCTSNNQQLTITTHSPYLLSSMNILLFAHQAGQINEAEANKIIPKESWVNPKDFNAYFIEKGGTARPIFNQKSGMIAENELDNISLDLGDEFDKLMNIYQGVTA